MKSIDYQGVVPQYPPWKLKGDGYVFIFRFPKRLLSTFDLDKYQNNRVFSIGALFLVDYKESPVGPYHEILLTPGIFKIGKIRRFSISKILVSSKGSAINGINNWGIPKELAQFDRIKEGGFDKWRIRNASFDLTINLSEKGFNFPISTSIMPLKLGHRLDDDLVLTTARAKGQGRIAKIENLSIKGEFPQIQDLKPIMGVKVDNFNMLFEMPTKHLNYFL